MRDSLFKYSFYQIARYYSELVSTISSHKQCAQSAAALHSAVDTSPNAARTAQCCDVVILTYYVIRRVVFYVVIVNTLR